MKKHEKAKPQGDYEVGFVKPPVDHQFKPGHKGKGGRPKGSGRKDIYAKVLGRRVTINDQGQKRRVVVTEAILLHLAQKALQSDRDAQKTLLKYDIDMAKVRAPFGPSPAEMLAQEKEDKAK